MKNQPTDKKKSPISGGEARNPSPKALIFPRELYRGWLKGLYVIARGKEPPASMELNRLFSEVKHLVERNHETVAKIWRAFTSERDQLSLKLLNQGSSVFAYAAGFHLINCARMLGVLERAQRDLSRMIFRPQKYAQIIATDYGAGTAALSHAFFFHFGKKLIEHKIPYTIHLIDQNSKLLGAGKEFLRNLASAPKVKTHKFMLHDMLVTPSAKWLQGSSDQTAVGEGNKETLFISFLGYVINELRRNPKAFSRLFELLRMQSAQPHIVFYFDPAEERDARSAMELRELFMELGYEAIYPCPRIAQCPMLQESRDWCYSEINWIQPMMQNMINEYLGISRSVLATAAYIYVSKSLAKNLKSERRHAQVVVGRPLTKSQKQFRTRNRGFSYNICTEKGIVKEIPSISENKHLRGTVQPTEIGENNSRINSQQDLSNLRQKSKKARRT